MTDAELERYAKDLEVQLLQARKRPIKTLSNFLLFRLLTFLSRRSLFPWRMAHRFSRSAAKRSPFRSLVLSEKPEGAVQPSFLSLKGEQKWKADRPVAIIVTHQTSRTGAPILALNLGEQYSGRYNIVFITLGPGDLMDEFRKVGTEVMITDPGVSGDKVFEDMLKRIAAQGTPAFAVVNSVESSAVLPALKSAGINVVTLVHEFATYTPNRDAVFGRIEDASVATVFSSRLTFENAVDNAVLGQPDRVHVIPQGRCRVPSPAEDDRRKEETARLLKALRPAGSEGRFLVLGAGTVELRKGLDLFIECANQLVNGPGGDDMDFVWLGSGYDPGQGYNYAVYLADQIRRSGLESRIRILPPTSEIEVAYRAADVLVLPSRLDPLPNVTVDAMSVGLPVVCFDRASGIAPILDDCGLRDACIARYLDPGDLGAKIRALAEDRALRDAVGRRSQEAALTTFDLAGYATRIEGLALSPRG